MTQNSGFARSSQLAEHARWNAPDEREATLLVALTSTVGELVELVGVRKQLHSRLALEHAHFPQEELFEIPQGRPITGHTHNANLAVSNVPQPEIFEAIEAGLAKAAAP